MPTQTDTFRLDHAGMAVPDLDAAIEWYGRVFGFTVLQQFSTPDFKAAHIIREGAHLEILQATPPPDVTPPKPLTTNDFTPSMLKLGYTHVAFGVPDVDAAFQQAVSRGATVVNPPSTPPEGPRFGHVGDLNQYVIELVGPTPPSQAK